MIRIFGVDKTNDPYGEKFRSNGDIVVQPTKAVIHKYENSDFYLEIEAPIDYLDYFVEGRIIVADVPWLSSPDKSEIFRICNVSVTHNKIYSKCLHITYDLDWFIPNKSYDVQMEMYINAFLANLYDLTQGGTGRLTLTVPSDTYNICEGWFDSKKTWIKNQSLLATIKALMTDNNLFLNRSRDTFYCTNERVETDTGITLEYGKNIQTFQKSESWTDTVHKIVTVLPSVSKVTYECPDEYAYYPAGYDKTNYIDFTKFIQFKSRLDASAYATQSEYINASVTDIEAQIDDYFKEHGKPSVTYTLNAYVDNVVDLGYKIVVRDQQMGVEVLTSVIGFRYNLLTEKYDEVTFGNFKNSMKDYNYKVNKNIDNLQNQVGSISHPAGSVFTTTSASQNPNSLSGFEGYWELLSSSGGIYTWERLL